MKTKKLLFIAVLILLACALAACGGVTPNNGNNPAPSAYPKIELSAQNTMKTEYYVGDELDFNGLVIVYKATASSQGSQIAYSSYPARFIFGSVDMTTAGNKTLKVTCENCSLNISLTVSPAPLNTPAGVTVNDFLISWVSSGEDVKNYTVEITYNNVSLTFNTDTNSLLFPYDYTEQGSYLIRVRANVKDDVEKSDSSWSEQLSYEFLPVGAENLTVQFEVVSLSSGDFVAVKGAKLNRTSIKIPKTIRNLPVKRINERAFVGSTFNTIEFSLDSTLTSIGAYAFENCSDLVLISPEIPSSVTEIGVSAFSGCSALKAVSLSENIKKIENFTFSGCSALETVSLPAALENIGISAFNGCRGLAEEITLPATVVSIGEAAFSGTMYDEIFLPSGLTSLGASAFKDCTALKRVTVPSGLTTLNTQVFMGDINLLSVNFSGDGILIFGAKAFSGCSNLYDIKFPSSLTTIGAEAFLNNTKLEKIILPEGITSVNESSFAGSGLKEITVPQAVYAAFKNLTTVKTVNLLSAGNFILQRELFKDNVSVNNIHLDEKFTSVSQDGGLSPFYGCTGLNELSIPVNIYSDALLEGCSAFKVLNLICDSLSTDKNATALSLGLSLDKVRFDEDILSVSASALNAATVKTVEIPAEIILNGGVNVLSGLSGISELIIISGTQQEKLSAISLSMLSPFATALILLDINSSSITDATALNDASLDFAAVKTLGIPFNLIDANIKGTFVGIQNLKLYKATAGVDATVVPQGILSGFNLLSLELSPTITALGENAIDSATDNFNTLTVQAGIQNLPASMPSSLKTLNLTVGYDGEVVNASVGSGFFNGITNSVQTVNFASDIEEINGPCFIDSTEIASFNIVGGDNRNFMKFGPCIYSGDGTKLVLAPRNINLGSFVTANDRYEYTVEESVLTLGTKAIPVNTIGAGAFASTKLQCVTIPLSVLNIEKGAFMNCAGLVSVTLPDSTTPEIFNLRLGDSVFENCTALTTIDLPLTIKGFGKACFKGCSALKQFTVAKSVTGGSTTNTHISEIPDEMFMNCTSLAFQSENLASVKNIIVDDFGTVTSIGIENISKFTLKKIGVRAFYGCTSLNLVKTSAGSITEIAESAFENCSSLTYFVMPRELITIGDRAFRGTKIQTNEKLDSAPELSLSTPGADRLQYIGNYAFENVTTVTLVKYPISLLSIGEGAFKGCTSLVTVNNSGTDTSLNIIGADAFRGCTALKTFVFCTSLITISDNAFYNCGALSDSGTPSLGLEISSSVLYIGKNAFYRCLSLALINIPYNPLVSTQGITSIGTGAFYGCEKLMRINIGNPVAPQVSADSFSSCNTFVNPDITNSGNGIIYIYVSNTDEYNNKWSATVSNYSAVYSAT